MGGGTRLIASHLSVSHLSQMGRTVLLSMRHADKLNCILVEASSMFASTTLYPSVTSTQQFFFFSSTVAKVVSTTFSFWRMGLCFTPKYSKTKHVSKHKIKYFHCYSDYCYLFSCASASHHKEPVAFKIC